MVWSENIQGLGIILKWCEFYPVAVAKIVHRTTAENDQS